MSDFLRSNILLFGQVEDTESDEAALQVEADGTLIVIGEDDD